MKIRKKMKKLRKNDKLITSPYNLGIVEDYSMEEEVLRILKKKIEMFDENRNKR